MTIPLKQGLIYGPVNSRRLGRSLGINPLPRKLKLCTFNCVYCQYGWTHIHGDTLEDSTLWPESSDILKALETALKEIVPAPDYLTFSGNGEPTLHPNFPELVDGLIHLRNLYAPQAKTAVLSNSTTAPRYSIMKAIKKLDVRIMKLDCGNDRCLRKYNHSAKGIGLEDIVSALKNIKDVTIQSLFSGGEAGNYTDSNIKDWLTQIHNIQPLMVQLYTLDRGYPSDKIFPVSKENLAEIKHKLEQLNVVSQIYF